MRLDKLLGNLGYGSRRDIHTAARSGRLRLHGVAIEAAERKLTEAEIAGLTVDGETLDPLPGLVVMLNKPVGMTCSHDEAGPLIRDLLPERWRRRDPPLSPAGRLDKDTSGLLLLTDDGALLHRIIAPKTHLPKRYRAHLAQPLGGSEAARFAEGTLMLKGETKPLRPARLEVIGPTEVVLLIEEGRYHQVRRMFAALGNHVEALRRESIGGLHLPGDLAEGAWTILDAAGVAALFTPTRSAPTTRPR